MISVVVAAEESDKAFRQVVRSVLEEHFTILCAWESKLEVPAGQVDFLLTDGKSFSQVSAEAALFLFKSKVPLESDPPDGQKRIAVVDSRDASLLEFVASTRLPAVTCGLSPRDTITLSSIESDSAVVDLQRAVTCFDGTVAEPQEIPVKWGRRMDPFALMAIASIFILSGNIDRLLQGNRKKES